TAAAETLTTIAGDPKHLGADIGVTAVLHTWGQNLQHHPHVHCIVPGGGLSPDGERWISCRNGFFLPVRVLSRLFRRLFLQGSIASVTTACSPMAIAPTSSNSVDGLSMYHRREPRTPTAITPPRPPPTTNRHLAHAAVVA